MLFIKYLSFDKLLTQSLSPVLPLADVEDNSQENIKMSS